VLLNPGRVENRPLGPLIFSFWPLSLSAGANLQQQDPADVWFIAVIW
jgi:hypothetical protein